MNTREEEIIKSILTKFADESEKLANEVQKLADEVHAIHAGQQKNEETIHELTAAKQSGSPIVVMKAMDVDNTIKKYLSQLFATNVHAEIGKDSAIRIQALTRACEQYIESNKRLKPRKPLLKVVIENGKGFVYSTVIAIFVAIVAIGIANKTVSDARDAKSSWGARAYHAALLTDNDKPGDVYDAVMAKFDEKPTDMKKLVEGMEVNAHNYQEIKKHIVYLLNEEKTTDIRVIDWENRNGEWWFLYRYLNEETERSIYKRRDGEVVETTDRIVNNLASAQKYYTRGIWKVIREAPAAKID